MIILSLITTNTDLREILSNPKYKSSIVRIESIYLRKWVRTKLKLFHRYTLNDIKEINNIINYRK